MQKDEGPISYQSVYRELRRRAQYFLNGERPGHTLQPTEIVHEVWVRMTSVDKKALQNRDGFLALAGTIMRNLLVDYARARKAERRGGEYARVDLPNEMLFSEDNCLMILEVDEMVKQLGAVDQRAAAVVEMKFFAGLTEEEIGQTLGVSVRTVKRDWGFAKAWMRASLERRTGGEDGLSGALAAARP